MFDASDAAQAVGLVLQEQHPWAALNGTVVASSPRLEIANPTKYDTDWTSTECRSGCARNGVHCLMDALRRKAKVRGAKFCSKKYTLKQGGSSFGAPPD